MKGYAKIWLAGREYVTLHLPTDTTKAVDYLTINEDNRLGLKLEEEKTRNEQTLQKLTSEIDSIKEAMAKVIASGEVKPL
jgi:hypothetical protein